MIFRLLAALGIGGIALISPLAAVAQEAPSYAQPAVPTYATQDEQIHGRIVAFDGGYTLQVRDDHGYVDNVRLHDGTVINPRGLTLSQGMIVSVDGYNNGPYFSANEIDTPYTFYNAVPYYSGHPWNYWGPAISLGFFFGNTGWWHGGGYGYGYGYGRSIYVNRTVRYYDVRPRYEGGAWRGRNYIAPVAHGGYIAPRRMPLARSHETAVRGSAPSGATREHFSRTTQPAGTRHH